MRHQYKQEAAVVVERMAREAAEADTVCVIWSGAAMDQLLDLVTHVALEMRKEVARGRIDVV